MGETAEGRENGGVHSHWRDFMNRVEFMIQILLLIIIIIIIIISEEREEEHHLVEKPLHAHFFYWLILWWIDGETPAAFSPCGRSQRRGCVSGQRPTSLNSLNWRSTEEVPGPKIPRPAWYLARMLPWSADQMWATGRSLIRAPLPLLLPPFPPLMCHPSLSHWMTFFWPLTFDNCLLSQVPYLALPPHHSTHLHLPSLLPSSPPPPPSSTPPLSIFTRSSVTTGGSQTFWLRLRHTGQNSSCVVVRFPLP